MKTERVTIGETIKRFGAVTEKALKKLPNKRIKKTFKKKETMTIDLRPKKIKKEKQYTFKEEEIGTKNVLFRNNRRGE